MRPSERAISRGWRAVVPAALAVLAAGVLAASSGNTLEPDGDIEQLRWMSGCWESTQGGLIVEERWLAPRGGLMLGIGRTLRNGRAVGHEFLRIFERDGGLVLEAHPSGQAATAFRAVVVSDAAAVFENPEHDFPQRIIYRPAPDSLLARIEGEVEGRVRGMDIRMGRIVCE
jgi:hypothetical protein